MGGLRALLRDERGQVLPFVAVAAMVLVLATGLVLVGGLAYAYAELVQQAADAGALAAASTAAVELYFVDPDTGSCTSPVPYTTDPPCRVTADIDPATAEAAAREAVDYNADDARFASRGLQVTNLQMSVQNDGTPQAGVTVYLTAEARVPLLHLFGKDKITIRRQASSEVFVNCGGSGLC